MQEAQNVKWKDNSSNRRYRIFGNEFTEYVLTHYEPKKSLFIPEMNLNNLIWQINSKTQR